MAQGSVTEAIGQSSRKLHQEKTFGQCIGNYTWKWEINVLLLFSFLFPFKT